MPLYDYIGPLGEVVELLLTQGHPQVRIGGKLYRRLAISGFAVLSSAAPPSLGSEILRGYRVEEERKGSRFNSEYSAQTIKRAWANDTSGHDEPGT